MKHLTKLLVIFCGLGSIARAADSNTEVDVRLDAIPLWQAVANGWVHVNVRGRNSSTGAATTVQVRVTDKGKREKGASVRINIEPGTVFAGGGDVQDMGAMGVKYKVKTVNVRVRGRRRSGPKAVYEPADVMVAVDAWTTWVAESYCKDYRLPRPPSSYQTKVVVQGRDDDLRTRVLVEAKNHPKLGQRAIQVATWIAEQEGTDKEGQVPDDIRTRFRGIADEEIEAGAKLYSVVKVRVDSERTATPVEVEVDGLVQGIAELIKAGSIGEVAYIKNKTMAVGPLLGRRRHDLAKDTKVRLLNLLPDADPVLVAYRYQDDFGKMSPFTGLVPRQDLKFSSGAGSVGRSAIQFEEIAEGIRSAIPQTWDLEDVE